MNNRIRLSKALILLILFLGVVVFGVLSCAQTLPAQQEISVYIYDETKGEWVDYDIQNGTGKIVAFPGTKFARSITPHEFDVETESYRKLYSFDGKTYSLSNKLGEQVPFYGTFTVSQKPVLYAYYEEKSIPKEPLELLGDIVLTKYVTIPTKDSLGTKDNNPRIDVKLNGSYTFKPDKFRKGWSIPSDWTLTKVKGIDYIQGDLEENNTRLAIYLSGTPYSSQEEVSNIKFEIPSNYVNDASGVIDSFGKLPGDAKNWTTFTINQAPFSMKDTTISMEEYTALNTTIEIKADNVPVLRDSSGITKQEASAKFNPDVLKPGTVIVDAEKKPMTGWRIEPSIEGVTYTVKSLDTYGTTLTLAVEGIPVVKEDDDWTNAKSITITMPENVILGASSASPEITSGDVIVVDTARSFVKMDKMEIAVEENTTVRAIKGITIPEASAEEVRITITSGATFNRNMIEIGSEIPLDTTSGYTETSLWKFPTRDGLKYTFGALSNNDRTLTIKIYGTLKDASPYTAGKDDIEIPQNYFDGGSYDSGSSTPIRRMSVSNDENIVWDYASVSATVNKDGSDSNHAIKGVNNVVFNSGDGANVEIRLLNAKFKAGLTGERIASWFKEFENNFGGNGSFVYKAIGGASGDTSSPYVLVNISGVSQLGEKLSPTEVKISIPYSDIEDATSDFGAVEASVWYENDTLKLSLGENGLGHNSEHALHAIRESQLTSGLDDQGQDVPGQTIQFVLENGQFDISEINSDTLSSWFDALKEAFGKDLKFSYTSLSADKDKLNVKVTGVPTSTNKDPQSATIKIPVSAIRGAKATTTFEYISVQVYYVSSQIEASLVLGENLYGTSSPDQRFNNPISGIRYTPLSSSEGEYQTIRVHLKGGKFISSLNDDSVSRWFASWDGISSSSYRVISMSSDRTSVDVAIAGVLTGEIAADASEYSVFYIRIPSTDIENPDFTETISVPLCYYTKGGISIKLGDRSVGTSTSPIKGIRYVSLGDDGVDLSVRIEDGEFDIEKINNSVVSGWFRNFNDNNIIIRPIYTIKEKTNSHITINIKGAISAPVSNVARSFPLIINKEAIKGEFVEDIKDVSVYYQTIDVVKAEFDNQNKDKYYGSLENPIEAISLAQINSGNGILVKINLIGGGETEGVSGPRFVSGLNNEDVSHWFDLCKDHITNASYTIEEGGKGKNYAVVRIKGGFTSAKSDDEDPIVLSVNIRSSDIEGFLPDDVGVKNGFAYKITSEISADLDPSIVYKGSVEHPIVGTNGVTLNNGEGYPVRVRLSGSVFSQSINIGKDVASWFNAFTDLSESEITITEMSGKRDAITILVKGVLIKDTDDVERVFINIPPDAIEGYLTSTVQVELFYQIEDKISASFTDGEGSSYYFGTINNPFSTVQYISRTLQMRVELSNAVFADISSSSVSKWFEAFNENISSPNYRFIQGGKDTNYAIIEVTGALKTDNLENQSITLSIPNSDIKDSYISTGIPLELTYCISDKVSALVSEEGSSNYGSIANPFTGTRHIKVGDTTLDGGKLIRIQLKNAQFVKNLSSNANISSWFKNWTSFTNAEFSIAGGGRGESFIIIRAKGILTDEVSRESRSVNIEIDKNAIDGYLMEDLKTPLYYKTTAEVEAVATVIGSDDNVIHGTYGVRLNNGDGVLVRIELKNGAVFGKDVTPPDVEGNEGADVSHWFSSLRRVSAITTPNIEDESYIVEEGGAGQNYVIVRIKGAYISTVSTTPNSYPLDVVASSTKVGDTYKEDGIYGALPSAVKVDLKFVNDKYVSATFVESAGYYGSEMYPIDGASYVALGGGDAGVIVSIKLTDGVVFNNDKEENEFNEGVAEWFKTWADAVLISGSERFEVINGGRGANYITIRINGQLNISTADTMSTNISISYDDIDGFLTSNVITPLYYKASKKVSVSLDSGSEYKGSASYPIAEKNNIEFGDGNGVLLRLNFVNGTINTDQVGVNDNVTSWFNSMIATSSGGDGLHNARFVVERVSEDKKSIIIKATGWLLTDSLKGVPSEVVVPSVVIDGSLPQDLTTTAYYCKTNDVTAYPSSNEGFYGASTPIQGTRYVALTDARGNKGQDVKIYLNGGKFSRTFLDSIKDDETKALKEGWFKGLDPFMSNATYELSYEGKGDPESKVDPEEITVHIEGALINSTNAPNSDGSYPSQNFAVEILSNQIANYGSGDSTIVSTVSLNFQITGIVSAAIGSEVDNNYGGKNNPISGVKYVPLNNGSGVKLHIELNNANFKTKPTSEELRTIWFEAFRSLVDDSDNTDEKYTCVGGGVDLDNVGNIVKQYNYVDVLIKGALNVDRLDDPYQVNVVIPNNAIDWNTGADETNLNIHLYYNTTGEVTAKLDTTGLYRGGNASSSLEGIKYIPMNNTQGYDVKISLEGTSFRWNKQDIDRDIHNWFVNFTEIRNGVYTVRPLPNDKSYVVVNIQGSLISDPGSAKSVKVIIPKDAIKAELNADVQLDLYYNTTGVVSADVSANGVDFVGSTANPIEDIQYLPLGGGDGVQVRITLHNATFNVDKDTDVSKWFANFRELTNGDDEAHKFSVVDGSKGSNVVVVLIKGALTSRESDGLKNINIEIQPEHINGDFDSPITTTLSYQTTGVVSAVLATEYDGTNDNAIEGVKYIDIGNGSGTTIRIDLQNGAKFSRNLTDVGANNDMETLFANFNSVLISPISSVAKYSITSGGRKGDTYVIININGALTSTNVDKQSVDLVIPTDCIDAFLPSNAPIKVPLYYITSAKVIAEFEDNNDFYYGSSANPLQGTRYIKFQSTSGEEKAQVYLKLDGAIFSDTLNVDSVKEWFRNWTNIIGEHQGGDGVVNGVRYTIDGGGQGMDYVIIGISGALTLQTAGKTIYTLTIPASDIKGAHKEELVEDINANLYYQSDSEVEIKILEGEYTITETNLKDQYVGSSNNPLSLIQNINVGNGKGKKIQISIDNAEFVSNDDNAWSTLLPEMFAGVIASNKFPQLNFAFADLSPDRTTLTINVSGYHSGFSTPTSQTIPLRITKDMIDKACVGVDDSTGATKFRAPDIVINNPDETYIGLDLVKYSIGTIDKRIKTYPNTPISEKIDEETSVGVDLTFELTNGGTFSDACSAQNLSAWFTAINAKLGSGLQYAYVARQGTGPGTNKLIVRVSGQTTATTLGNDAANAIIDGNFIEGALSDFRKGNAFTVPIYWNVSSTPESTTTGSTT